MKQKHSNFSPFFLLFLFFVACGSAGATIGDGSIGGTGTIGTRLVNSLPGASTLSVLSFSQEPDAWVKPERNLIERTDLVGAVIGDDARIAELKNFGRNTKNGRQTSAGRRPRFVDDCINGNACLDFSASQMSLWFDPLLDAATPMVQITMLSRSGSWEIAFDSRTSASADAYRLGGLNNRPVFNSPGVTPTNTTAAGSAHPPVGVTYAANDWFSICLKANGAASELSYNGVTTIFDIGSTTLKGGFILGETINFGLPLDGQIQEVAYWRDAPAGYSCAQAYDEYVVYATADFDVGPFAEKRAFDGNESTVDCSRGTAALCPSDSAYCTVAINGDSIGEGTDETVDEREGIEGEVLDALPLACHEMVGLALSGSESSTFINRWNARTSTQKINVAVNIGPTNDIDNVAAATSCNNMQALTTQQLSDGVDNVIVMGIHPQVGTRTDLPGTNPPAFYETVRTDYNTCVESFANANSNVEYIDLDFLGDGATPPGLAASKDFGDGKHLSNEAERDVAALINALMSGTP